MALPAAFTGLSGEAHPAALAPTGGARAAVVSNGEALGWPAPPGDPDWLDRELANVLAGARGPGAGLITDSDVEPGRHAAGSPTRGGS